MIHLATFGPQRSAVRSLARAAMTILYEPGDMKVSFLWAWNGTVFPLVFEDPMFWVLMAVHAVLLYVQKARIAEGSSLPELAWDASVISMSLLTFFVIFYGNHCYARYFELHAHCVGITRTILSWAHAVKTDFSHCTPARRWNMMRTMLAAMHAHYAHLRREENDAGVEVTLQHVALRTRRPLRSPAPREETDARVPRSTASPKARHSSLVTRHASLVTRPLIKHRSPILITHHASSLILTHPHSSSRTARHAPPVTHHPSSRGTRHRAARMTHRHP